MLQVVLRAGGHLAEDELFGRPATEQTADSIDEIRAAQQELIAGRELERIAEGRAAPRDDADLAHGVGMLAVGGHQGVADLVIGNPPFLLFDQPAALALGAGDDLLDRVFDVVLGDRR